jgi:hypothetical protein
MRKRAAVQEIQKDAIITLKHSNQVIAIPTNLIAVGVVRGIPDETTLILSNKPVKTIISVRNVTGATPDRVTSFPMVVFLKGPKGASSWGNFKDNVAGFVQLLAPEVGGQSGNNKHMVEVVPLVTGEH